MIKAKHKISTAVIVGTVILLLLFAVIANLIGYAQFTETITAQYRENALSIAAEAAHQIDTDDLGGYLESGGTSDAYTKAHASLQSLCDNMEAEFIYVIDVDETDYNTIRFLIEVVNQDSAFDEYPVGLTKPTTNEEYRARYRELYEGSDDQAIVVRDKGWIETGSHITALVPLRDADGKTRALLAVQRQMVYLNDTRLRYLTGISLASLLLILLASVLSIRLLNKYILRPVAAISTEADRFASENTLPEKCLSDVVTSKNELGMLAKTIDETERKTIGYFSEMAKISADRERMDTELNLAYRIQESTLPYDFPTEHKNAAFDICASMDPAKEVGGDLFDMYMIDKTHLCITIADVSGKGIPAALFMMIAKTLIKTHVEMGLTPAEVFTKVNHQLCEGNKMNLFVTAWMGVLDLESGMMVYVNAGHNMPVLLHGNECTFLKTRPGFVLAGMDGVIYRQHELRLDAKDRLYLYTDGITEATSAEKTLYGDERLLTYLNAHQHDTLTDTLTGLRADIDSFVGEAEQFDDMTTLFLQYNGKADNGYGL